MNTKMHPSRRAVLASAAILPLAAVRGTAANDAIKVGVIGTGNRGPHVAGFMAKHTPARITALCDLVDERMQRTAQEIGGPKPKFYSDYRQLLDSDVDAVLIATPVYLHAEHFEAAVKAGKHIYIEKPASVDVAGCKRIIKAADSADRKLNIMFGFQRRYGQLYRKAYGMVERGEVGEIRLATARFMKSESAAAEVARRHAPATEKEKLEHWYSWKEYSGDLIVENNIHSIDVLNWFVGDKPVSAIGSGGTRRQGRGDVRDHNFVAYTYPNGTQGQLTGTTAATPGYREVLEQFFGEKVMLETSETHMRCFRSRSNDTREESPRNMTIDAVEDFVKRIAEGRPDNTAIRGAESTLTAILGRMAMDAKREVTWDEMMKG